VVGNPCAACLSAHLGYRPFLLCHWVLRYFSRTCGNCKWRDYTSRCSIQDKNRDNNSGSLHLPQAGLSSNGGDGTTVAPLLINNDEPGATA